MADILAEAGLSAGSIYSNFADKADLVRYVARTVLGAHLQGVFELADESTELSHSSAGH